LACARSRWGGTSIGAIIGAAYAAGHGGRALRDHMQARLADRVGLARRLAKSRARHRRLGIAHPVLIDGERFFDAFWRQPAQAA
jgi:NTE family protein